MAVLEFLEEYHAGVLVKVNLQACLEPVGNGAEVFQVVVGNGCRNLRKHIERKGRKETEGKKSK